MEAIYLDHAATTPIHPEVVKTMYPAYHDIFGNHSSIHGCGRKARHKLNESRTIVSQSLGAHEREIICTSGGTEVVNLALIGLAFAQASKDKHIITTVQEHQAVLQTAN